MSNHRQAADPGPSLLSIWTMAGVTLATIGYSVWIAWGATDDRHWVGVILGMLLAVVLTAQTIVRASERAVALERIQAHRRRRPVEPTPQEAVAARWPEPIQQMNPPPEEVGAMIKEWEAGRADDTQRLPSVPVSPSPAARSLVAVPLFRDERERAEWLHRQDTEIFTRPPDWQS